MSSSCALSSWMRFAVRGYFAKYLGSALSTGCPSTRVGASVSARGATRRCPRRRGPRSPPNFGRGPRACTWGRARRGRGAPTHQPGAWRTRPRAPRRSRATFAPGGAGCTWERRRVNARQGLASSGGRLASTRAEAASPRVSFPRRGSLVPELHAPLVRVGRLHDAPFFLRLEGDPREHRRVVGVLLDEVLVPEPSLERAPISEGSARPGASSGCAPRGV